MNKTWVKIRDLILVIPCAIINNQLMRAIVVGAGTVGTATGTGLSLQGHDVEYVDVSEERVKELRGWGHKATTPDGMNLDCDAVFVSVNTPPGPFGIDATNLLSAAKSIGVKLRDVDGGFPLIIFRSTQPPGTTRNSLIPMLQRISGKKVNTDFGVAYWPEYLRAESAQRDFLESRVIVISTPGQDDRSHQFSARVTMGMPAEVHWLPLEAAELQKYFNNVGNAVKISTYNWFRRLAAQIGIREEDVEHIFELCALSAEGLWNPKYGLRNYGPYGGACLPKDTAALIAFAETAGMDATLLKAAEKVNQETSGQ